MRELVAWIVRHPRQPMLLAEFLQVVGSPLEFRALPAEIAHALVGLGAEILAALRDEGVEIDFRILLLPEAAELVQVGKFFVDVLSDLVLAVERPLLNPALDPAIHRIGQRFIGSRLVPLASFLTFGSNPVRLEPSVAVETNILALGPVEAWNVFPLGARGGPIHRSGLSSLPRAAVARIVL